jgi:hypothetical protein
VSASAATVEVELRFLRAPPERFRVPARANLGRRVFGGHVVGDSGYRGGVRLTVL